MKLEKWRACDGQCCRVAPLRPIESKNSETGRDCYFRNADNPERGCRIMDDPELKKELTQSEAARYKDACEEWPHNSTPETQKDFAGCCWRWVKDGNR